MEDTLIGGETNLDREQMTIEYAELVERACLQRGFSAYNAVCYLRERRNNDTVFEGVAHTFHSFLEETVVLNVSDGKTEENVREILDDMTREDPLSLLHYFRVWIRSADQL